MSLSAAQREVKKLVEQRHFVRLSLSRSLSRLEWNALAAAEGRGKGNTFLLRHFEAVVYHPRFLGGSRVPVRFFRLRGRIQQETGASDHDDDDRRREPPSKTNCNVHN